jgi:hypothetical protein
MLIQKHHRGEEANLSPEQLLVWVTLPVRVQLCLQVPLSSADMLLRYPFMPQEIHMIEVCATHEHISIEAALVKHIKTAISEHEKMKEIIRQVHQKYPKEEQVVIDVKLLGEVIWDDVVRGEE